jgi:hypothetical protein
MARIRGLWMVKSFGAFARIQLRPLATGASVMHQNLGICFIRDTRPLDYRVAGVRAWIVFMNCAGFLRDDSDVPLSPLVSMDAYMFRMLP